MAIDPLSQRFLQVAGQSPYQPTIAGSPNTRNIAEQIYQEEMARKKAHEQRQQQLQNLAIQMMPQIKNMGMLGEMQHQLTAAGIGKDQPPSPLKQWWDAPGYWQQFLDVFRDSPQGMGGSGGDVQDLPPRMTFDPEDAPPSAAPPPVGVTPPAGVTPPLRVGGQAPGLGAGSVGVDPSVMSEFARVFMGSTPDQPLIQQRPPAVEMPPKPVRIEEWLRAEEKAKRQQAGFAEEERRTKAATAGQNRLTQWGISGVVPEGAEETAARDKLFADNPQLTSKDLSLLAQMRIRGAEARLAMGKKYRPKAKGKAPTPSFKSIADLQKILGGALEHQDYESAGIYFAAIRGAPNKTPQQIDKILGHISGIMATPDGEGGDGAQSIRNDVRAMANELRVTKGADAGREQHQLFVKAELDSLKTEERMLHSSIMGYKTFGIAFEDYKRQIEDAARRMKEIRARRQKIIGTISPGSRRLFYGTINVPGRGELSASEISAADYNALMQQHARGFDTIDATTIKGRKQMKRFLKEVYGITEPSGAATPGE